MPAVETARARAFWSRAQACMGGWCAKRDHCPHFHADERRQPAERLCVPGADGVGIERKANRGPTAMSQPARNADELPAVGTPVERPVGRPVPEREKDHTLHLGITRIACMLLLSVVQ